MATTPQTSSAARKTVQIDELKSLIGQAIGESSWVNISQEMINNFADVTGDHQFIHVDIEKARDTPFGGTIAHGFLTLSLLSKFAGEALPRIAGSQMGINYGFEKVRFLAPVPAGANIRGRFTLASIEQRQESQMQLVYSVTVDIEGSDKPALFGEWITLQIL